jgi:hypothetical protein
VNGVTVYRAGQATPMLVDGQPPLPRNDTHEDDHPMHSIGMSSNEGNGSGTLILSPFLSLLLSGQPY